jgi:adrenodoxin-NADP+ reductase
MFRGSQLLLNRISSKLKLSAQFCNNVKSQKTIRTCIVGSGPAGFYAAQYLLKHLKDSQVDMIEKLPVPFGLVRFGVAPDHPEVKNVISTFTKTAENLNFNFYGNVSLGKDVTLAQLRQHYDIVLLAYGADIDSKLNIDGEGLNNVISARELVAWYNGLPSYEHLNPNLSGENVVILGQGNVAIDVARILLSPIDELRKTDITEYAIEALSKSRVKNVYVVGRRGPLQAAFTIKELREMIKLSNVNTIWRQNDFIGIQEKVESLPRPKKRITELMLKNLNEMKLSNGKNFYPVFFRSPLKINGNGKVDSVDFCVTKLVDEKAIATNEIESINAELVCRSIGYKSISVDSDINFDEKYGRIVNKDGRIFKKNSNEIDIGLYTAGWLATGPQGVILTTMNNSFGVAQKIIDDVNSGILKNSETKPKLNFKSLPYVSWKDWEKINEQEIENGKCNNKPREKIFNVNEMLKVVQ